MTIVALVIVGGLAASMVTAPLERLLEIVPDDTFYYLQIARNLIATGRTTADGFSATNGYHPLWLAVLTTLAAVISDRELLLRATVGVSLALHLVASWLIGVRVGQVAGPAWGRTAALCWLLNRVALVITLQAMESTLYVVLLLVALGVHLRLAPRLTKSTTATAAGTQVASGEDIPRRELMIYGVALGFVTLARTEGAIVAAAALVWLAVRLGRMTNERTAALVSWSVCAAALLLTVLPASLFSLWQVGTVLQDSGRMKALWAGDHWPDAAGRIQNLLDTASFFLPGTVRLIWYSMPAPVLTFVLLSLAAVFIAVQWHRPRGRVAVAMRAAVVPATMVVVIYGLTLVDRMLWWMGLPWLAMFLTATLGMVWLCRSVPALRRRQWMAQGVMVAVSMIFAIALARGQHTLRPYPFQVDVWRSQAIIERSIPLDQRIGCFNSGIPMYFGTGRIVALDGLVSHDALGYWADHRFDDYLRAARVRFIADDAPPLERALRFSRTPPSVRFEELRTFPLRGAPSGKRILWSVEHDQAAISTR